MSRLLILISLNDEIRRELRYFQEWYHGYKWKPAGSTTADLDELESVLHWEPVLGCLSLLTSPFIARRCLSPDGLRHSKKIRLTSISLSQSFVLYRWRMGATFRVPMACCLKNYSKLNIHGVRKKKIFLPVHLFCKWQEKSSEIPFAQLFFYLQCHPEHTKTCRMELSNPDTKFKKRISLKIPCP